MTLTVAEVDRAVRLEAFEFLGEAVRRHGGVLNVTVSGRSSRSRSAPDRP